jgi:hypothetical protein
MIHKTKMKFLVLKIQGILFTVFFSFLCIAEELKNTDSVICGVKDTALSIAENIRGLKIKKAVECRSSNREEVKGFVLKELQDKKNQDMLYYSDILYKSLGALPEDYNLTNGITELYTSQIGGYYDPKTKRYVLAEWIPEIMQMGIAIHELTHALQDQHYNLTTYLDKPNITIDERLARQALVEGDATLVMYDATKQASGQLQISQQESVEQEMFSTVLSLGLINTVPEVLKTELVFPYVSGLRFAHYLLKKGGYKAIDKAFKNPPKSTEEVLHLEKYGSGKQEFSIPKTQEMVSQKDNIVYTDTVGEFFIANLLGSSTTDKEKATQAAAGWGGDKIVIVKNDRSSKKSYTFFWTTLWDTELDAVEFFKEFLPFVKKREESAPKESQKTETENLFTIKDFLRLEQKGKSVYYEIVYSNNH